MWMKKPPREFMLAFSRVLVDALLNKESVDIKAIGRFLEDEHLSGNVKFEASLPLASAVNRSFSCFDPIELDDENRNSGRKNRTTKI